MPQLTGDIPLRETIDEYRPPNEFALLHAEHPWILRCVESEISNGKAQRTGTPKPPPLRPPGPVFGCHLGPLLHCHLQPTKSRS